jgi:hypothetical protein
MIALTLASFAGATLDLNIFFQMENPFLLHIKVVFNKVLAILTSTVFRRATLPSLEALAIVLHTI